MNTKNRRRNRPPPGRRRADLADWRRPETTPAVLGSTGKKVAYRNLWISVPALLLRLRRSGACGASSPCRCSTWASRSPQAELFTLTAIAGIAGATMRIPASFLIRLAGGRNTIFLTTAMLLAPGHRHRHRAAAQGLAAVVVPADGAVVRRGRRQLRQSMSNISTFFPKRLQGTALGLNAGLGNSA